MLDVGDVGVVLGVQSELKHLFVRRSTVEDPTEGVESDVQPEDPQQLHTDL